MKHILDNKIEYICYTGKSGIFCSLLLNQITEDINIHKGAICGLSKGCFAMQLTKSLLVLCISYS